MSRMVRIEFLAELHGEVNGQPIHVVGEGSIVQALGVTSGTYFTRQLPENFDPKLLAGCLVTGYPSACALAGKIDNPFGLSDYSYCRTLGIPGRGKLDLAVNCRYEGGRLVSTFLLHGAVQLPSLKEVGPITETWGRTTECQIDAYFDMHWTAEAGQTVVVEASSRYHIENPSIIPETLTRSIEVTPRVLGNGVFTLFQISAIQ